MKILNLEMEKAEEKEFYDGHDERGEVYTKAVRAGKRTYFFDVKATRKDDYYLTVTESKRKLGKDGKLSYEKHKIFLYKEDFEKFIDGLTEVISYINAETVNPAIPEQSHVEIVKDTSDSIVSAEYTSVEFEDLGEK